LTGSGGKKFEAAVAAPVPVNVPFRPDQVQPQLAEGLTCWQATGVDTSALSGNDVRIADLGGLTVGTAVAEVIWLDDNAAGWGWFVSRTPRSDFEFTRRGNHGEKNRMEPLTVLTYEVGHLLGDEHEPGEVMQETWEAGTRRTTGPAAARAGLDAVPTSVAWTADTPWIDGFVRGTVMRR
jgi:hypothetical protein